MTTKNTPYHYKVVRINSMYDGDSVRVRVIRTFKMPHHKIDFGFNDIVEIPEYTITKNIDVAVRMYGFDTPELRDARPMWKAAAYMARDIAKEWMESCLEDSTLFMQTHKDSTGKYGRYLANFYSTANNETLRSHLIKRHLAVHYEGNNKSFIERAHASNIDILLKRGLLAIDD